ncbi:class I SAM-dependent methyltransferase [Microbacterium lushaniae]|uniref:Class I SAM-dependent methyltransferase n=1 Tax=Microbacterium lushaniae TaxID=2614639 RepID=A0A5J6L5I0_9MICO|nr:class I SAM-dependent methyltransferase [Microbacterium lushaniae]QEW03626.1 class I SAM-dependent methyltransferase [Microbacterium lushaniae]
MASREEMSTSFGAAADTYEAGRPSYPAEAVEWMLQPVRGAGRSLRVADVGAGTGKLTRAIVEHGAEVVAIDPDAGMLENLRANVAGVPTFVGRAESLPLPDAAVDAVLLGQAWHWVDVPAASAEAARVLRAGGVLGLVWNVRDERTPWVRRMTAAMHGSHAEEMMAGGGPSVAAPFDGLEDRTWRWSRPMTRDDLFAMARSRSYVLTAEPAERARIEQALAAVCDEIGAVGDAVVDLPYVTRAFRSIRP